MRILITGGLGFIGSFLAEQYLQDGHEVVLLDDRSANVVDRVKDAWVIEGDCASPLSLAVAGRNVDLVVHAASPVGAVALLDKSGTIASEILRTTQAVVTFCADRGVPLVNISTSEVYGFSGTYAETDACIVPAKRNARLEYGVGKLAAEFTVQNTRGLRSVTVRPFNVAGPRQTSDKGFVLPTFCEQALTGRPLTVFGDGSQQRCFTAVHDLARFIVNLRPEHFDGRVVNVGTPTNQTTITALANLVLAKAGGGLVNHTDGKTVHGEDYEEAEGHTKCPDATLARAMGWQPAITLAELVDLTLTEIQEAQVAA